MRKVLFDSTEFVTVSEEYPSKIVDEYFKYDLCTALNIIQKNMYDNHILIDSTIKCNTWEYHIYSIYDNIKEYFIAATNKYLSDYENHQNDKSLFIYDDNGYLYFKYYDKNKITIDNIKILNNRGEKYYDDHSYIKKINFKLSELAKKWASKKFGKIEFDI